jgi:hypothetical protein
MAPSGFVYRLKEVTCRCSEPASAGWSGCVRTDLGGSKAPNAVEMVLPGTLFPFGSEDEPGAIR